ncbi:MAG: EspF repeat-containing protein [Xanthobacteraceae bacterium]
MPSKSAIQPSPDWACAGPVTGNEQKAKIPTASVAQRLMAKSSLGA